MDDSGRLAHIEKQLKTLPGRPGVYVIYNKEGEVIYVGKAKNLSNRVRSHFSPSTDFSKSRVIREQGARIEVHQVQSENEALLLEYNMIQEHQPDLNERWKDGKTYPYLEVTTGERFPRFVMTRERDNSDSVYLGPYSNVGAVKRSLRYVLKLFPVADCRREIHLGDSEDWAKTCIRRRTKQCLRPCEVEVDPQEYRQQVNQVIRFMEGKLPEVAEELESQMYEASERRDYEDAAKYRDLLKSIKRTMQRQNVFLEGISDTYIVVQSQNEEEICIVIQKIEDGRVVRQDSNVVGTGEVDDLSQYIISFMMNLLDLGAGNLPDQRRLIVETDHAVRVMKAMQEFGFEPQRPTSDVDQQLADMARRHATRTLQRRLLVKKDKSAPSRRVDDLQQLLSMDFPPFLIDCFDVSTLMGTNTVASCVRFKNAKPLKKGYRRFKIRTVETQDDFASMEEVVFRRYRDVEDGIDPKGLPAPDLVVIDGGREQLKRAQMSLESLDLDIPVIGLAKQEEEIYMPGSEVPIREDKNRPAMLLLRAVRDEAHRFAVRYQKKLRQREGLTSILDGIPGIGPVRKKKLLREYKTVAAIAKQSSETLAEQLGLPQDVASRVITASRKFTTQENDYFTR